MGSDENNNLKILKIKTHFKECDADGRIILRQMLDWTAGQETL
jgi:hypothetical protein